MIFPKRTELGPNGITIGPSLFFIRHSTGFFRHSRPVESLPSNESERSLGSEKAHCNHDMRSENLPVRTKYKYYPSGINFDYFSSTGGPR